MKYIMLTKGRKAIVDNDDFEYLNQWKWHYSSYGYAVRTSRNSIYNRIAVYMHREIIKFPSSRVDHIDGNRLNNQKSNLRLCNSYQNIWNSRPHQRNKTGYKGITWESHRKKWRARIGVKGKRVYVGEFQNKDEAIRAYNAKALEYHGEFAWLNPTS